MAEILGRPDSAGVSVAEPSKAAAVIATSRPRVTVVDEATGPSYLVEILAELRKMPIARLIFLRQEANNMVVFDSRSVTIEESNDLMKAVGVSGETGTGDAPPSGTGFNEDPSRRSPTGTACKQWVPATGRMQAVPDAFGRMRSGAIRA